GIFSQTNKFCPISFIIYTLVCLCPLGEAIKTGALLILRIAQQHPQSRYRSDKLKIFTRLVQIQRSSIYRLLLEFTFITLWIFITELDRGQFGRSIVYRSLLVLLVL